MADANGLQNLADIPGLDSLSGSGPNPETEAALDTLFAEANGGAKPPASKEEEHELQVKADAEAKEKAAAEAKAKEEADAKAKAEAEAKANEPEPTEEEKAAAAEAEAKAKAEKEAADKAAEEAGKDEFDKVELPPYTKPKTAESFAQVKTIARQRIAEQAKELDELRGKVKELSEKGNGKIDPAVEKELIELRKFRASVDVEADPAFNSYDTKIQANNDAIFAKLAELNTPKDAIDKLKELGLENVDWDSVKMSSPLRRFIESKLASNIDIADQKKTALAEAKKNSEEYLKTRRAEFEKKTGDSAKEVEAEINTLGRDFTFLTAKQAKKDAKPEEIKAIEAHNKIVGDIKEMMSEAVSDPSPRMRALLALGTAQFVNLRAEHARVKAEHEAKVAAITKELDAAKALIEKVKKGSTVALRDSNAAPNHAPKPPNQFDEKAGDAVDRIAREVGAIK